MGIEGAKGWQVEAGMEFRERDRDCQWVSGEGLEFGVDPDSGRQPLYGQYSCSSSLLQWVDVSLSLSLTPYM